MNEILRLTLVTLVLTIPLAATFLVVGFVIHNVTEGVGLCQRHVGEVVLGEHSPFRGEGAEPWAESLGQRVARVAKALTIVRR